MSTFAPELLVAKCLPASDRPVCREKYEYSYEQYSHSLRDARGGTTGYEYGKVPGWYSYSVRVLVVRFSTSTGCGAGLSYEYEY
eukprot:scaffold580606_cov15-Prasinocladus_malaysianus.AAC.1